jgi:hypothetical protein
MQRTLFFTTERPEKASELVCPECGKSFMPRRVTDGVEELCDACYELRFPVNLKLFAPIANRGKRDLAAD